jgi:large subunit ribosomal protein L21
VALRVPSAIIKGRSALAERDRAGATTPVPDTETTEIMYAIIRAGGKQARVSEGDVLDIERIKGGPEITFTPLLVVKDDGTVISDRDKLEKASVTAEVLSESRGQKVDVFKYKAKTGYRRRSGHRQTYSRIQVKKINVSGRGAAKKAKVTAEKPKEAAEKPKEAAEKPKEAAEKPKEAAEKPKEAAEKAKAPEAAAPKAAKPAKKTSAATKKSADTATTTADKAGKGSAAEKGS